MRDAPETPTAAPRRPGHAARAACALLLLALIFAAEAVGAGARSGHENRTPASEMPLASAELEEPTIPQSVRLWGPWIALAVLGTGYAIAHFWIRALQRRVEQRTEELANAKRELEAYSTELERRVAERTADLSEKNQALEETLQQVREMQNQLLLSEKMASLGTLVAGVAHEINTPVGALNSAADVNERALSRIDDALNASAASEGEEAARRLEKLLSVLRRNNALIIEAGGRVAGIVRSLRNFSRLDESERKQADVHEGIESTLILARHELKDRVTVVKEFGTVPPIYCYPNQLNQVFMNLFVNAAHAIDGQGELRIRTSCEDGKAHIEIADTGKGIPADAIERIFDPGFTTKGVGVGTGLGLSISYSIISKHEGTIAVESKPGSGTTFKITLPVDGPKGSKPASHAASTEKKAN